MLLTRNKIYLGVFLCLGFIALFEISYFQTDTTKLERQVQELLEENEDLKKYKKLNGALAEANDKVNLKLKEESYELAEKVKTLELMINNNHSLKNISNHFVDYPNMESKVEDPVVTRYHALVLLLETYNKHGEIRNRDKFTLAPDHIPIVIRVFDKHEYLERRRMVWFSLMLLMYFKFALENYKKMRGIEQTIMVVSHDGVFPEVFKLVESIDFCQVKQIIHPFSGHMLTNRFPGPDPTLPDHRDQYGNPRPFPHTALKHHFWWHLNTVWDVLFPTHKGDIVLAEEDHVPTVDFYESLKTFVKIRDEKCPETCFNVQMHEHGTVTNTGNSKDLVYSYVLGNIGVSFNRKMWTKVKKAAKEFCTFDEYNWDWTLTYLQSINKLPKLTVVPVTPRALHLGKCGTHFKGHDCSLDGHDLDKLRNVNTDIENEAKTGDEFKIRDGRASFPTHTKGYGGWAHPADQKHCMDRLVSNALFDEESMPT